MRIAAKQCSTVRAWRATRPSLRQVHLLQSELLATLSVQGHAVRPGDIGENVTTRNIDLLALPTDTELHLGPGGVVSARDPIKIRLPAGARAPLKPV